jgi:hypothetical protein
MRQTDDWHWTCVSTDCDKHTAWLQRLVRLLSSSDSFRSEFYKAINETDNRHGLGEEFYRGARLLIPILYHQLRYKEEEAGLSHT